MNRNKMLIVIAAVALGIAGAVSSAQAGNNQSATAAHASTTDKRVKAGTRLILIQRSNYGRWQLFTRPLNPVRDDFEGYPH